MPSPPTRLVVLALLLAVIPVAGADEPASTNPRSALRVLFLGKVHADRGREFTSFLGERFAAVHAADRWYWDRALLEQVDVVVLDWPQQDGVSKWMLDGDRTVPPRSPLGARETWATPTVLVGSAGLNTAWAWDVKGGFG